MVQDRSDCSADNTGLGHSGTQRSVRSQHLLESAFCKLGATFLFWSYPPLPNSELTSFFSYGSYCTPLRYFTCISSKIYLPNQISSSIKCQSGPPKQRLDVRRLPGSSIYARQNYQVVIKIRLPSSQLGGAGRSQAMQVQLTSLALPLVVHHIFFSTPTTSPSLSIPTVFQRNKGRSRLAKMEDERGERQNNQVAAAQVIRFDEEAYTFGLLLQGLKIEHFILPNEPGIQLESYFKFTYFNNHKRSTTHCGHS